MARRCYFALACAVNILVESIGISMGNFVSALLIFTLLAVIIMFMSKKIKISAGKTNPNPQKNDGVAASGRVVMAAGAAVKSYAIVNLEEEIRVRAYELSQQRNGQYGDMDGDWYAATKEVCARYEANGYETYKEAGSLLARKPSG